MDIILWTHWIYLMMDLPLVDIVCVLIWCVPSQVGYRDMWCAVLLCWPRSIVGWVHWPSANQSIRPVVELPCKNDSQQINFFPLLRVFNNCMLCSIFPYSYLLLRMYNAYVKILFVLIHLICSRWVISINLPVWPKYDLLYVSHCNLYMLLEFYFVSWYPIT
jgi:hypothetical protein